MSDTPQPFSCERTGRATNIFLYDPKVANVSIKGSETEPLIVVRRRALSVETKLEGRLEKYGRRQDP